MEGIVKEINEKKKTAVVAGEDERDYQIDNKDGFMVGDILSFEKKEDCIDCKTIKKEGHVNLDDLEGMSHNDCSSCGRCCGF